MVTLINLYSATDNNLNLFTFSFYLICILPNFFKKYWSGSILVLLIFTAESVEVPGIVPLNCYILGGHCDPNKFIS